MKDWTGDLTKLAQWIAEKSGYAALIAAGDIGTVALVVPGLIASALLGLFGFSAAGPVAGTAAAGAQAGIGNVAAHSSNAVLQSAAMGGYGVGAVLGAVQAIGGL